MIILFGLTLKTGLFNNRTIGWIACPQCLARFSSKFITQNQPRGDLFPLRVFACNAFTMAIAYVIEWSKQLDWMCRNAVK